jgi:hypothetical protein
MASQCFQNGTTTKYCSIDRISHRWRRLIGTQLRTGRENQHAQQLPRRAPFLTGTRYTHSTESAGTTSCESVLLFSILPCCECFSLRKPRFASGAADTTTTNTSQSRHRVESHSSLLALLGLWSSRTTTRSTLEQPLLLLDCTKCCQVSDLCVFMCYIESPSFDSWLHLLGFTC